MKKLSWLLVCSLGLFTSKAHAFDTSLRGFIALDALNFEKISGEKASSVMGIGVLDLKVFAQKDDMGVAIKMDLDGKLDKRYNIFEEAYVTYRGIPDTKLMLGKGVVRFQNLHWGAVVNSYQDGGTVISTENSFKKFSRKAFMAASYGSEKMGFINQITVWGDSSEINTSSDNGAPETTMSSGKISGYKTSDVTAFDTKKQIGFANKLDLFFNKHLKMNLSGIYYKNRLITRPTYGVDVGLNYESDKMEIWMDALWGVTSKLPYESFTTYKKYEYFMQLGMEYFLTEKWSVLSNNEYLLVNDQQYTYDATASDNFTKVSGNLNRSHTYKIELAAKYKFHESAFVTLGALYENKRTTSNGVKDLDYIRNVYNPNTEAYKLLSSVSFWF